jgi:tryptophan synthase beta chain
MKCRVFMGEIDVRRQYPNVYAMKLLGAEVVPVRHGTKTLKDAVNAALKYWSEYLDTSHYLLGSVVGPHPYPAIVRDFQSVIGRETRRQIIESEGRLPDHLVACVGGGSNSIGLFHPFLEDDAVKMTGVEAGGSGPSAGMNAVRFGGAASVGVVQGYKSYFIQNEAGQVMPTHSVSAGLDYAGIGPELASLHDAGRIEFTSVTDQATLDAFEILARDEGIIPALESAHAVAHVLEAAKTMPPERLIVVNISGRGDKDIFITAAALDGANWKQFLENEVRDA